MQIDFSAAFGRVDHPEILHKLYFVSIGGSMLYVLTQFLHNRSQHVLVDSCWSKLLNVVQAKKTLSCLILDLLGKLEGNRKSRENTFKYT